MKTIGLSLVLILLCVSGAQAYVLTISAPETLQAGAPLVVTGNTTFPVGTQFTMVFSFSQITTSEVSRRIVVVGDTKSFIVPFETTGLPGGQYKVEAELTRDLESKLSSGSVTSRVVQLIDRSGEVHITSPLNQTLGDALFIEAYISDAGEKAIEIGVTGPNGLVFGPRYISTTTQPGKTDGYIVKRVAVTDIGNYYVQFADAEGYIGTYKFTVSEPIPATSATPVITTEVPGTIPGVGRIPLPLYTVLGALCVAGVWYVTSLRRKPE
jgi:hypothetical protein